MFKQIALAALLCPTVCTTASLAAYKEVPFIYDPNQTFRVSSQFMTSGKRFALVLRKTSSQTTPGIAGATIKGITSIPARGFKLQCDVNMAGQRSATSPRWVVDDELGNKYTFFYTTGVHKLMPDNWDHILFQRPNSKPLIPQTANIVAARVLYDDGANLPSNPGYTMIDNVIIGGVAVSEVP